MMTGEREQVLEDRVDVRNGLLSGPGQAAARVVDPRERAAPLSILERTIEREVLPRLVLAHRVAARPAMPPVARADVDVAPAVAELVRLVLGRDAEAPASYVAEHHGSGMPIESLYLDLMAPAARHLGWLWEEDICDFSQVTVALGRLHHLVRAFSVVVRGDSPALDLGQHALLVPAPGEQHTFGLAIVAELFRHGGWTVWSGAPDSLDELLAIVRRQWFAVVGFSLACEARLDQLAAAIRRLRRASRNRAVGVMVGGPTFVAHPELVAMIGADATAVDGRQALRQAQALVTLLADRG